MEFTIKILCKKEDREIVRGALRQFSGKIYAVWCDEIKRDERTGYDYQFTFTIRHGALKKVLRALENEGNLGATFNVRIEDWA